MQAGPPPGGPLSAAEREEFEQDLISFCDRALGLLGDVSGMSVLYAGGAAPLWLEGLSEKIGPGGSLTALEADSGKAGDARSWIAGAGLPCTVRVLDGDVFSPPFAPGSFDLVYSAGLLHELDTSLRGAEAAISALAAALRPGGRLATDDFIDSVPAVQLADEALEDEARWILHGEEPYGIGGPGRLISLHQRELAGVTWRTLPPFGIRHLDRLSLAETEEEAPAHESLQEKRLALRGRIAREGYTRPATLYVEGRRPA
ncbi:class I SAM-dependent methyltransferase [Rubrobacter aplysinae]|uniref:class I SAM-dependent methyltransferase n=1 Tax=Rubrobacter aplysinae TaxID=909625 RepID=UPI00064C3E56|nr:class I SAM-dependent methyltransferase [Rubrobacter aplysinae]